MPRKCDPMTASVIEQVKTDLVTQQCDPCPIASFESSAEMRSRVPPTPTVSEAAFKGFPVGLYPRYSLESGPHTAPDKAAAMPMTHNLHGPVGHVHHMEHDSALFSGYSEAQLPTQA